MAKGYDNHQERVRALSLLGKDLARRAKSKCEVCLASGVPLQIHEVAPAPKEPDPEHVVMVCTACDAALSDPSAPLDPKRWRILTETLWNEAPSVQVCVIRLLQRIAREADWARETLDEAYLEEDILDWAAKR
jgi:protein PhnA